MNFTVDGMPFNPYVRIIAALVVRLEGEGMVALTQKELDAVSGLAMSNLYGPGGIKLYAYLKQVAPQSHSAIG